MPSKRNIQPQQWTAFWKALGIEIPKRNRFLARYDPRRSDFSPLVKMGVDRQIIETAYTHFSHYYDRLVFHKFCKFFRRDPDTVQRWTNASSRSEAFERLFNRFRRNDLASLRARFRELWLLSELNRKGEGRRYEIKYRRVGSLAQISGQRFTRVLNRHDSRAKYAFVDAFDYGGAKVVCIRKTGQGRPVYKFIKLLRVGGRIEVQVSADSKAEYKRIRSALIGYFNSYVDSPQSDASLDRFRAFMFAGQTEHFGLVEVSYFQDDYRITVAPKFRQPADITAFRPYRNRLSDTDAEQVVGSFRISHKELAGRAPVTIDIRGSASDIIGALLFVLQDRRLNSSDRERILLDFRQDFGFNLGSFISYADLNDKEIYRRFLQVVGRREGEIDLRSERALDIYKALVKAEIIGGEWRTHDDPRYCVNRDCRLAYGVQRKRNYCANCGERLLAGRTVVQPKVNEKKAAQYVASKLKEANVDVELFQKKLLGRDLSIASVQIGEFSVELVPISGLLSPSQVELLRLRFPNAWVLTARDNEADYSSAAIECWSLHDVVYELEQGQAQKVEQQIQNVATRRLDRARRCVADASQHYTDAQYYRRKNSEKKNLGAELFEAYTHLLLAHMFRNSIWLGASRRGTAVPDGISAIPIVSAQPFGCFLWDSKYAEGNVSLGTVAKNQTYITAARRNETIRDNGGLGGFVFVSNRAAPTSFRSKYKRLGGPRAPKVVFLRSGQLSRIYQHYQQQEDDFLHNEANRRRFIASMQNLFLDATGGNKIVAVADEQLDRLLGDNEATYVAARVPRVRA